jgi:hypothetical protein
MRPWAALAWIGIASGCTGGVQEASSDGATDGAAADSPWPADAPSEDAAPADSATTDAAADASLLEGGATDGAGTDGGASESGLPEAGARDAAGHDDGGPPPPLFDWVGVVGTGQSLAVGGHGNAPAQPIGETHQRFHNLKLSLGGAAVPPFNPANAALSMVPLVEPLRAIAMGYPSPYPANMYGESSHTAMADEITSFVQAATGRDYVTAHTEVGEAGQPMSVIEKGATDTGTTGRAYAASLFEVAAISRLAKAAGKTYGVGAVLLTHGEADASSTTYEADLVTLITNYNTDLPPLTGQSSPIPLVLSQQHSAPATAASRSPAAIAQWSAGVDHPGQIVCAGPKYQYPYVSDNTHLTSHGYELLGEKYGQAFAQLVGLGQSWAPLQPVAASRAGRVITVQFQVPVPPLAWDTSLPSPHQSANTAWAQGQGFEVRDGATAIAISSVVIQGDTVQITCASDLSAGVVVGYASTSDGTPRSGGTVRWGLLHDSDPFVGSVTGAANPNYCVAFEMTVP